MGDLGPIKANKCSGKCLAAIKQRMPQMLDGYEGAKSLSSQTRDAWVDLIISTCASLAMEDLMDRITSFGHVGAIPGKLDPGACHPVGYWAECPYCSTRVHNADGVCDRTCEHLIGYQQGDDIFVFADWRRQ